MLSLTNAIKAFLQRLLKFGRKGPGQSPYIRFSVISDIHVQYWDEQAHNKFDAALKDLNHLVLDALIINGDLGDGRPADYAKLQSILSKYNPRTVWYTIGNHEFYHAYYDSTGAWSPNTFPNGESDQDSITRYLAQTGMPGVYYDRWMKGYHFIFLGSEQYRQSDPDNNEDAWLSPAQLEWLRQKLQENYVPRKPMFVFLHQPLQDTVSGSVARGVVQQEQFMQLLSAYPEVLFFSGHTHWELSLPTTLVRSGFTMINSSSVSYPYDETDQPLQGNRSEGLIIEVYENRVHIRGRDFAARSWILDADYNINL